MAIVRTYQQLQVWQRAMDLAAEVYRVTRALPPDERFGLTSQMRRAAVSIASNIAEGQGRATRGEFKQFLSIADGSLQELETQLLLCQRLAYLADDACQPTLALCSEVGRMLGGLQRSLNATE